MKRILIAGAGQLGSRHLQSLNLLNQKLDIMVIDPNPASLEIAKSRFEMSIKVVNHRINYSTSLLNDEPIDVAIVASTAHHRRMIIENILGQSSIKHLVLEKLLFTMEQDYSDIQELLAKYQTKTWVNCCMRLMPFYQNLNAIFNGEQLQYNVTGSQYGLVTNAIHYLDHMAYLTGKTDFELDTKYLDIHAIESKRLGYYELTGTIIAHFSNGSIGVISCDNEGIAPVQIEIFNKERRIISREWEQKAWQTGVDKDWRWEEVDAPIPFQSTLTASMVSSLLETNNCALTSFNDSKRIHLQLLNPLKDFLIKHTLAKNENIDYPFT